MADYEIKFKTTAEGQGAKQTADHVKEVNKSVKELQPELDKSAQKTSFLDQSKSKLAKTLKELSHQIPGLGIAIKLLTNPYAAATAAIAAFIVHLQKQIRAQNEVAQKAAELNASLSPFVGTISTMRDRSREAAGTLQEMADALRKIAEEQNNAANALGEEEKAIDRQIEGKKKVLQLEKDVALERLKVQHAAGEISDEEFAGRTGAVEAAFAGQGEALDRQGKRQKVGAAWDAQIKAKKLIKDSDLAIPGLQAALAQKKNRLDKAKLRYPEADKRDAALDAELANEEAAAELDVNREQANLRDAKEEERIDPHGVLKLPKIGGNPTVGQASKALATAESKLAQARAARAEIAAAGRHRAGNLADMTAGVATSETALKDVIGRRVGAQKDLGTVTDTARGLQQDITASEDNQALTQPLRELLAAEQANTAAVKETMELLKEEKKAQKEAQDEVNRWIKEAVTGNALQRERAAEELRRTGSGN